jgi:hypothetical protein
MTPGGGESVRASIGKPRICGAFSYQACKPDSVEGGNPSVRLPGSSAGRVGGACSPCTGRGLASRPCRQGRWWALTPPFHPYRPRLRRFATGGLFSVPLSVGFRRLPRGSVLPCGVRTFLDASEGAPRSPGLHRECSLGGWQALSRSPSRTGIERSPCESAGRGRSAMRWMRSGSRRSVRCSPWSGVQRRCVVSVRRLPPGPDREWRGQQQLHGGVHHRR